MTNYFRYLNIGPMEERWGFYITTIGHSSISPNQNYPNNEAHPQNHSFSWNKGRILNGYYLVFISNGQGVFESALTPAATVTAGTCFFLYPGVWHRYKPHPNSGWEEYWIGFKGNYADELMNKGFFDVQKPFIRADHCPEILSSLNKMMSAVQGSAPGYHQVIAGITLQILGILNAVSIKHEEKTGSTEKLIAKAKFILEDSAHKAVDMEKLVRHLPMGYSKFRKAFKLKTGVSPNQYHLNLRVNKARDLLLSTGLNINEVANQTGFPSVFYFSKLFKKKTGVSPKIYRKGISAGANAA
ncbi:MAG: AraC family transcriptional regulator [Chitinophagaceae bacterium]